MPVSYLPPSDHFNPVQALASAGDAGLTDVLIVGYDEEGKLVFRNSHMRRDLALFLVEQMKAIIMKGDDDG